MSGLDGQAPKKQDAADREHQTPALSEIGKTLLGEIGSKKDRVKRQYQARNGLFAEDEKDKAFSDTAAIVKEYSNVLIKRWGKEIDAYLVFAGLYSAVLTAFNVESYRMLQPSQPQDPVAVVLQHISLQISSLSYMPPSINSSYPAFNIADASSAAPSAPPPRWAVWLNTLWFTSLVLGLSSASIGILVKQWLNEFQSGLLRDGEQIAELRQYRLKNIKRCHVGTIVNAIPVLLQAALALFFAGLLVLLWSLHHTVAAVTGGFISTIVLFIIATTLAPLITPQCAYLSSQSLAAYTLWLNIAQIPRLTQDTFRKVVSFYGRQWKSEEGPNSEDQSESEWKYEWSPEPGLNLESEPEHKPEHGEGTEVLTKGTLGDVLDHRSSFSWIGWEHHTISKTSTEIQVDMFSTAYEVTLSDDLFASAANCMARWSFDVVLDWSHHFLARDIINFGRFHNHFKSQDSWLKGAIFWCNILLCIAQEAASSGTHNRRHATNVNPHPKDADLEAQVAAQLGDLIGRIPWALARKHHGTSGKAAAEAVDDARCIDWIIATALTLCALKPRRQHESPHHLKFNKTLQEQLEQPCIDLMAKVMGHGTLPMEYFDGCARSAAAAAINLLQSSGYSPDTPPEHLGEYLRGHALLLYALVIHNLGTKAARTGNSKLMPISNLNAVVKSALSELSTTLGRLAKYLRNNIRWSPPVFEKMNSELNPVTAIIGHLSFNSLAHIMRLLRTHLVSSSLQLESLVPQEFGDDAEAFFDAFMDLGGARDFDDLGVPWDPYWIRSDVMHDARELIKVLRIPPAVNNPPAQTAGPSGTQIHDSISKPSMTHSSEQAGKEVEKSSCSAQEPLLGSA